MAPSIERHRKGSDGYHRSFHNSNNTNRRRNSMVVTSTSTTTSTTPCRNVTFAINYDLPMVDQFYLSTPQQRKRRSSTNLAIPAVDDAEKEHDTRRTTASTSSETTTTPTMDDEVVGVVKSAEQPDRRRPRLASSTSTDEMVVEDEVLNPSCNHGNDDKNDDDPAHETEDDLCKLPPPPSSPLLLGTAPSISTSHPLTSVLSHQLPPILEQEEEKHEDDDEDVVLVHNNSSDSCAENSVNKNEQCITDSQVHHCKTSEETGATRAANGRNTPSPIPTTTISKTMTTTNCTTSIPIPRTTTETTTITISSCTSSIVDQSSSGTIAEPNLQLQPSDSNHKTAAPPSTSSTPTTPPPTTCTKQEEERLLPPRSSSLEKVDPSTTTSTMSTVNHHHDHYPSATEQKSSNSRSCRNSSSRHRRVQLSRSRVRYDMELVPRVIKNSNFLNQFGGSSLSWWDTNQDQNPQQLTGQSRRSSTTSTETSNDSNNNDNIHLQSKQEMTHRPTADNNTKDDDDVVVARICQCPTTTRTTITDESPFLDDSSVVWVPSSRSEWEDSAAEMTALCTSAALRRHHHSQKEPTNNIGESNDKNHDLSSCSSEPAMIQPQQPFHPPISRVYVLDRIDIDDPLNGYQIRHRQGGWLQGFVLFTHFTTWTLDFHWDSLHPLCGITIPQPPAQSSTEGSTATTTTSSAFGASMPHKNNHYLAPDSDPRFVDVDGTLSAELEALSRSGDPSGGGIVFDGIAEIALLGGLGCGEYLLRMALDDIRSQKYQYVVLEASVQAIPFYQKFGFVRVGATCQYGSSKKPSSTTTDPSLSSTEPPTVGYRHWTHANETERSLQLRGGPSYMMCLKLPPPPPPRIHQHECCAQCGKVLPPKTADTPSSFVKKMLAALQVSTKPRVEHLGGGSTPGPKARRSHSLPISTPTTDDGDVVTTHNGSSSVAGGTIRNDSGRKQKWARRKSMTAASTPSSTMTPESVAVHRIPHTAPPVARCIAEKKTSSKKRTAFMADIDEEAPRKHPNKRIAKTATPKTFVPRRSSLSPATSGRPLSSYVEKQYNSVWLAVPPSPMMSVTSPPTRRPPPKDRSTVITSSSSSSSSNQLIPTDDVNKEERDTASPRRKKAKVVKHMDGLEPPPLGVRSTRRNSCPVVLGIGSKEINVGRGGKVMSAQASSETTENAKTSAPNRLVAASPRKRPPLVPATQILSPTSSPSSRGRPKKILTTNIAAEVGSDSSTSPECHLMKKVMKAPDSSAPTVIDRTKLRKQRVKSYPRNEVHYYNRVVKPTGSVTSTAAKDGKLFFVVEYDPSHGLLCLVHMHVSGTLQGRRNGRPRYQCQLGEQDAMFFVVLATEYDIVPSAAVMKTPVLALEAWDIATEKDRNFETR